MARKKSLKSILHDVVSQNKEDNAKLERHVVEKLLQDARAYAMNRVQSSRREPSERIDRRFLTNVVKNVNSHNKGMLKMREKFTEDRPSRHLESKHDMPASPRSHDVESPQSSGDTVKSKTRRHASFDSTQHSSSRSRTQHRSSHSARLEEEHIHRHRVGRSKHTGDERRSDLKESSQKTTDTDERSLDGQPESNQREKRHRTHSHEKGDSHEKNNDQEHRHRRQSHSSENKHQRDIKRRHGEEHDRDRSHRKRHKKEEHSSRSRTQPERLPSRSVAEDESYSRSKNVTQVSKMDKYFDEHYDPRVDLDLKSIVDPKTGLVSASSMDDWNIQSGALDLKPSVSNVAIRMDYSSRGQTREWDKGKGRQA